MLDDETQNQNPPEPVLPFCHAEATCDSCGKRSMSVEFTMKWTTIVGNAEAPPTVVICSACLGDAAISIHEHVISRPTPPRILFTV